MSSPFPSIAIDGGSVDPKQYIEKGTNPRVVIAFVVAALAALLSIVLTSGILLIVLIGGLLFARHLNRKATALIHGSGIKVDEGQFPEIHGCVRDFARRFGIAPPEVYIVESNIVNAMAVKYGRKNVILLTDDLIHGCLYSGVPQALAYVLGHELAHVALGHNRLVRSWLRQAYNKLGRLDEYSADMASLALVGDKKLAFHGLLLLTVGYSMIQFVNVDKVLKQAEEVAANKYSRKAEKSLTHPLLLNRLAKIMNIGALSPLPSGGVPNLVAQRD